MKYSIFLNEKQIAEFENEEDMEAFLQMKREQIFKDEWSKVLDRIAEEEGLDRNSAGIWPLEVVEKYYFEAKKKIEQECVPGRSFRFTN